MKTQADLEQEIEQNNLEFERIHTRQRLIEDLLIGAIFLTGAAIGGAIVYILAILGII